LSYFILSTPNFALVSKLLLHRTAIQAEPFHQQSTISSSSTTRVHIKFKLNA
jgi:hypothetical protein